MRELTLKMVRKHLQDRMRKRMAEHPEQLDENLIDAVCLDCINFRLMLEMQKGELLAAIGQEPNVAEDFLGKVAEDLAELMGEDCGEEQE